MNNTIYYEKELLVDTKNQKEILQNTLTRLESQKEDILILSNKYSDILKKERTRLYVKEYRTTLHLIQKLEKEIKNVKCKLQTFV
jgi:nitrogen-specific signal transduction histidine kinase